MPDDGYRTVSGIEARRSNHPDDAEQDGEIDSEISILATIEPFTLRQICT